MCIDFLFKAFSSFTVRMNSCIVKYLLAPPPSPGLHNIQDYEYTSQHISHTSFQELEQAVKNGCPSGYYCKIPLAMHHELVWKQLGKIETDKLYQPIFQVLFFTFDSQTVL